MTCFQILGLGLWLTLLTGQAVGLRCMVPKSDLKVGDVVTFYCITDFKVFSTPTKLILKYGEATEIKQIQTASNVSLTTTLTAKNNYQKFVCKERNGQELISNCNLIPLTIPTIVTIRSHKNNISEGDTAAYSCSSKAQPAAVTGDYKWYFAGSLVTPGSSPRIQFAQDGLKIKILNTSYSDNNSEVKCEVINSVGANGTDSMKLKIFKPANKALPTTSTVLSLVTKVMNPNTTLVSKKPDVQVIPTTTSIEESDIFVTGDMYSTVVALELAESDTISAENFKIWYYNVIEGTAIGGFVLLVILIMFTSCLIGLMIRKKNVNTDWKEEQEREKRKLKRLSIIPDETRIGMTVNGAYVSPTRVEEFDTVGYINDNIGNHNSETATAPLTNVSNRSASLPLTTFSTKYDDSSHQDYVNTFPRQHDDSGYVNAPGTSEMSNVFNFDQMQVNAYLNEEYNRLSQLYEDETSLNNLIMQMSNGTTG